MCLYMYQIASPVASDTKDERVAEIGRVWEDCKHGDNRDQTSRTYNFLERTFSIILYITVTS